MKKVVIGKKYISRYIPRLTKKPVNESKFWKKIALEQQILLHAKNNT